tara:strand:- start:526 stop:1341 length:816 start_codon:yes stop_codon:yes gene_type:complete
MKKYYDILGIDKTANLSEIKNAYRKLAVKYHPDKNSEMNASEMFIEITEAYNYLIENHNNNFKENFLKEFLNKENFNKSINMFFNAFIHKNKYYDDKIIYLECSLEELYFGAIKNMKYERKYYTTPVDIKSDIKNIQVLVQPGMKNNEYIRYEQLGDNLEYSKLSKDLIIVIKEKKHEIFKRKNNDLITKIDLSLKEALLCNTKIEIPLLNNKFLLYTIEKIINPNTTEIILNNGMSIFNSNKYGNLIIEFNIIFPKNLNEFNSNFKNFFT